MSTNMTSISNVLTNNVAEVLQTANYHNFIEFAEPMNELNGLSLIAFQEHGSILK